MTRIIPNQEYQDAEYELSFMNHRGEMVKELKPIRVSRKDVFRFIRALNAGDRAEVEKLAIKPYVEKHYDV